MIYQYLKCDISNFKFEIRINITICRACTRALQNDIAMPHYGTWYGFWWLARAMSPLLASSYPFFLLHHHLIVWINICWWNSSEIWKVWYMWNIGIIKGFASNPTTAVLSPRGGHTHYTTALNDAKLHGDARRHLRLAKQSRTDEDMPFSSNALQRCRWWQSTAAAATVGCIACIWT